MEFLLSTFLLASQITLYYIKTIDGIVMPDECSGLTVCTSDTDYPQKEVDDLLINKDLMSYEINLDINHNFSPFLGVRQGEEMPDEIKVCDEIYEMKEVRYIVDENDNVRVVAQNKDRFLQYIPITRCKSPEPSIDDVLAKSELEDKIQNIKCEENKLDLNFVVLSPDLQSLELARVKDGGVPVGCQFKYID